MAVPDPLRILVVCQGDLTNASTKHAVAFAEALADKGHSILLSLSGDPTSAAIEHMPPHPRLTVSFRREYAFRLGRATLREAQEFSPHVLHVFNPRHYTVTVARQFHRVTRAVVVVHWEDDELGIRRGVAKRSPVRRVGRLARRLLCYPLPRQGVFVTRSSLRWVKRSATMCDALTPALAASVQAETGMPCMTVLPTSMGRRDLRSDLSPRAIQSDAIRQGLKVAYTGSVHPESIDDFRLAARAVATVVDRGYNAIFVHTGHTVAQYDLQAVADAEGLPGDRFVSLGYVSFGRVPLILADASVLVQPGRPDRFNRLRLPSKVQAYLESGTPTVMFSVGLGELLQDRVEVIKLHGFSADELADRIVELFDDPQLADRVGEGGQEAARRLFDQKRNTSALLSCYRTALGIASSRP